MGGRHRILNHWRKNSRPAIFMTRHKRSHCTYKPDTDYCLLLLVLAQTRDDIECWCWYPTLVQALQHYIQRRVINILYSS